jgi:hypothetical protein
LFSLCKPFRRTLCPVALLTLTTLAFADPIPVKHAQGTVHGFLTIHSGGGLTIGYGEFTQTTEGDRVTGHLVLHFRDGSLDDETQVFTEHGTFQFVSDHHIQHGPFFPVQSEIAIDAGGNVTLHSTDKKGKSQDTNTHMDLGPDIANGMIGTILANIASDGPEFKLGMVVPSQGKPRLIHFAISPAGQERFSVTGSPRKATVFRLHPVIGGIEGVLAPIVNKQPPDTMIWVLEGDAPLFVREVGQLSEDGPVVSIEFAGASFPHQPAAPPPAPKKK